MEAPLAFMGRGIKSQQATLRIIPSFLFYHFFLRFTYFWGEVGLRCYTEGFSSCSKQRLLSHGGQASHHSGFSC